MKKFLFWFLLLFVGLPVFAALLAVLPKSDQTWLGSIFLLGGGVLAFFYLGAKGAFRDEFRANRSNRYALDKARHEGYQQGRNEAMRRNW